VVGGLGSAWVALDGVWLWELLVVVVVADDFDAGAFVCVADRVELELALALSPGSRPAFMRPASNPRITRNAPPELPAT
jgi:hypothetical protein